MPTKAELRWAQRKKRYVVNLENEVTMKKCYAKNADKHKREYSKTSYLLNPKRKRKLLETYHNTNPEPKKASSREL